MSAAPGSKGPSRKDRLRPLEFIIMALVIGIFVGLVVLLSTREPILALVFAGVAFVVSLVVLAMLALAVKPGDEEKLDLTEQDKGSSGH